MFLTPKVKTKPDEALAERAIIGGGSRPYGFRVSRKACAANGQGSPANGQGSPANALLRDSESIEKENKEMSEPAASDSLAISICAQGGKGILDSALHRDSFFAGDKLDNARGAAIALASAAIAPPGAAIALLRDSESKEKENKEMSSPAASEPLGVVNWDSTRLGKSPLSHRHR